MDEVIDMLNALNNEGITDQQDLQSVLEDAKQVYARKAELLALRAKYTQLHSVAQELHCFVANLQSSVKLYDPDFNQLRDVLRALFDLERAERNDTDI